ncbi:MAG: phosphatase PAP2 family protein [Smithellaceae bacterium]
MTKKLIATIVILLFSVPAMLSYIYWDVPLAYHCKSLSRSVLDIAEIVTTAGESKWYYILLVPAYVIVRYLLKNKLWSMRILFLFISISASGLINLLIKWLAGRHRPINMFNNGLFGFDYFQIIHESTSFPSGHAVTAFTLAAAISILFPRWSIPGFAAAVAIGVSRILITSHYLSDVLAGAGLGILCTLAVKYIFDRYNVELSRKPRR